MSQLSFEQEVKSFLTTKGVNFQDKSDSFKEPDFTIYFKKKPFFFLEVKEKRQKYNMKHWPPYADEANLFILDDLTVRKCLAYSPISGVLVRDNVRSVYCFLPIVDLALMPKLRLNRQIQRAVSTLKGKWLLNMENGSVAASIDDIFTAIRQYVKDSDKILFETLACYGNYKDETIEQGGITRKPSHWEIDVKSTR